MNTDVLPDKRHKHLFHRLVAAGTQSVPFKFYINPCFSTPETTLTVHPFHLPLGQQRQDITVSNRTDILVHFNTFIVRSSRSRLIFALFIQCSAQVSLMTSDGNTQIEKVTTSLVRSVTSEDPPNLIIICEIYCVPRIESYTGNMTLVVRLLDVHNLVIIILKELKASSNF